jgi:hypothetical protein
MYMELLVKLEILTSDIYGPTFRNAEFRLFLFAAHCFNTESVQKLSFVTVVCKYFASYQGYPYYRWDLIRYVKGYPRDVCAGRRGMPSYWLAHIFD